MSRIKRITQIRNTVEKKQTQKYWLFIQENPDKEWNWVRISGNTNITWDIIIENLSMPWDWYGISKNPNITWDIIRDNPDMPWDQKSIFSNTFQKEKELFLEDSYKEHLSAYKIQNWQLKVSRPTFGNYIKSKKLKILREKYLELLCEQEFQREGRNNK